ncbi:ECs_2282 family putative zinc-binding protein [Enterobacter hormaechei]
MVNLNLKFTCHLLALYLMRLCSISQRPAMQCQANNLQWRSMKDIKFSCPKCGEGVFKPGAKVNSLDDLNNTVCGNCGREFTKDDVIEQTRNAARELLKGALRR